MPRFSLPSPLLAGLLPLAACATTVQEETRRAESGPPAEGPAIAAESSAPGEATPASAPWTVLATSREGRPLRQATFGHGPRRVVWVGGIHGDEREGARASAELAAAFLAEPGALERVTLLVLEDLNPDGSAQKTRGNARGVDLNRNFPAANFRAGARAGPAPLSEPESLALFELLVAWRPELVLVAHSWRQQQFVNFDGPARALAERFAARAGFALRESKDLAPTPGSLGSWANERELALLTLEYRRGTDPEEAWATTRAAILEAILGE